MRKFVFLLLLTQSLWLREVSARDTRLPVHRVNCTVTSHEEEGLLTTSGTLTYLKTPVPSCIKGIIHAWGLTHSAWSWVSAIPHLIEWAGTLAFDYRRDGTDFRLALGPQFSADFYDYVARSEWPLELPSGRLEKGSLVEIILELRGPLDGEYEYMSYPYRSVNGVFTLSPDSPSPRFVLATLPNPRLKTVSILKAREGTVLSAE